MTDVRSERRVVPARLRWVCAPDSLPPSPDVLDLGLGQERAISAIQMGAAMPGRGYNIFAAGPPGSGRVRSTKRVLSEIAADRPVPPDRAYVHNFSQPDQPRLVTLPPGKATALRRSMDRLVELLRASLPGFFEDEIVESRRRAITEAFQRRESELLRGLSEDAERKGFAVVKVEIGQVSRPEIVPVVDGRPVPFEKLREDARDGHLSSAELARKEADHDELRDRLAELVRQSRAISREMNRELEAMVREEAGRMLSAPLGDIEDDFADEEVTRFLAEVRDDVLGMLTAPFEIGSPKIPPLEEHLARYGVNVVADRAGLLGAPVVVENYPTMINLFGAVAPVASGDGGPPRPPTAQDVTAGSLLDADGGFLVVKARDVLGEPGVWDALKRTLSTQLLEIQRPPSLGPFGATVTHLKPEPIPISVRVVLVGEPAVHDVLWGIDPDFRRAFMVKAEFDPVMERTAESIGQLSCILDALCAENHLRRVAPEGTARILEWSARQAGGRGKMLARFGDVEDLLREASYQAGLSGSSVIGAAEVEAALNQRRIRNGRLEERALELMTENVIRISVDGETVGQVNGLSVLDLGYHRFGKPTRITATTSVGRAGIINIEREARLSGGIYDKGVLIITGWLRRRYAQERGLTLTASLCFEQSYAGVDGDSASIAEVIALLSELSGCAVDQAVAVTGSLDQHGDLQPIGGLNEKVEGFFDLCRQRGLTGRQGVMFPESNLGELNLRQDVAEAVESGRFSLYALRTLSDAVEIALGVAMEEIDEKVTARLEAYGQALMEGTADLAPSAASPSTPLAPAAQPPEPPAGVDD